MKLDPDGPQPRTHGHGQDQKLEKGGLNATKDMNTSDCWHVKIIKTHLWHPCVMPVINYVDIWLFHVILCLDVGKVSLNLIICYPLKGLPCLDWIGFSIYPLIICCCLSQIDEYRPWLGCSDQFIICPTSAQHSITASHTAEIPINPTQIILGKKTINFFFCISYMQELLLWITYVFTLLMFFKSQFSCKKLS